MPPWAAVPGYGHFANENVVTLRESQFIVSWMEGLGPRNAGRVFTNTAAQAGGPPPAAVQAHIDLECVAARPARSDARSRRRLRGAWPPGIGRRPDRPRSRAQLSEARRVRAVEYMPGDRRVVRAAFFTVQETGQWIGSWTPWYGFMKLPAEAAYQLPPARTSRRRFTTAAPASELSIAGASGCSSARALRRAPVSDFVVDARKESGVAARNGSRRFHAETILAADTALLALRPDVVPGLASIEVAARRADGTTDVLLFAKDIPFEWPTPYIFREPVRLRRGTKLAVTAYVQDGARAGRSFGSPSAATPRRDLPGAQRETCRSASACHLFPAEDSPSGNQRNQA